MTTGRRLLHKVRGALHFPLGSFLFRCLLCFGVFLPLRQFAAPAPDLHTPIGFFTNVASRLLRAELNLDLGHIQLYPTNQYTPAAHRLLQLTANLYDATTNRTDTGWPYLPSVFRPQFTNDGGAIFIAGYVEESTANFWTNAWRDLTLPADRDALQPDENVIGIPLLIGARKGFPSFNEFSTESISQITRRMRVVKPSLHASRNTWTTNLMYGLGISNVVGVETWYPYTNNYPRSVCILAQDVVSIALTDDYGLQFTQKVVLAGSVQLATNEWQGSDGSVPVSVTSFQVPLLTNLIVILDSVYRSNPPGLTNLSGAVYETNAGFPTPQWILDLTHQLRFLMVDQQTQRPIDVANLAGPEDRRNLTGESFVLPVDPSFSTMWNTNRPSGAPSNSVTIGMIYQVLLSLGFYGVSSSLGDYVVPVTSDPRRLIDDFRAFELFSPLYYPGTVNTNLVQEVPFTP